MIHVYFIVFMGSLSGFFFFFFVLVHTMTLTIMKNFSSLLYIHKKTTIERKKNSRKDYTIEP